MLTCEDPGGPTPIYFTLAGVCCRALAVLSSLSGVLLCVPKAGIPLNELEDAESSGYLGVVGPFTEADVPVSNKKSRRTLSVLIFDLEGSACSNLSSSVPDGIRREDVVRFGLYRSAEELPDAAAVFNIAQSFVQSGGHRLDSYFSAQEGGEMVDEEAPDTPLADGL